jgi:hypothetical protein
VDNMTHKKRVRKAVVKMWSAYDLDTLV